MNCFEMINYSFKLKRAKMRRLIIVFVIFSALMGFRLKNCITIVDIPDTNIDNDNYISTREPLVKYPLIQLPLGSVHPNGWLETQLNLMTDGYTGHLYEISQFLKSNSGWIGGDERGWEEAPYWLLFDGLKQLSIPRTSTDILVQNTISLLFPKTGRIHLQVCGPI
jgi:hypothetical protein